MPKKIPEEIREAVIRDYNNNVSAEETSKKYNIGISVIANIRNQYNIKTQYNSTFKHTRLSVVDSYDDAKINDIINDYKKGTSKIDICVKYNISDYMLYKILQDNNVDRNRLAKLTKEQEQEIIQMYLNDYHIRYITKKYHISESVLKRLIDTYNIPKRKDNSYRYKITDKKIIDSIIDDYSNTDMLVIEICKKYDISDSTLTTLLRKNNVRTRRSIKQKSYVDSDIINDYKNGIKIVDIVSKYNISRSTVYRILKRNNI